jgi:YbbR domain-containing protein
MRNWLKLESLTKRNLIYKVLAFFFAILLWILAGNREIIERTVKVSVVPVPTGNYRIVDFKPKLVEVEVEGFRKDIFVLEETGKVEYLLPEKAKTGKFDFELSGFKFPPSVKVKRVVPKSFEVKVRPMIKKAVAVKFVGKNLPPGYTYRIVPNYAVVFIPEGERINYVQTETVDFSGIKGDGEVVVNLKSPYPVIPKEVKVIFRRAR